MARIVRSLFFFFFFFSCIPENLQKLSLCVEHPPQVRLNLGPSVQQLMGNPGDVGYCGLQWLHLLCMFCLFYFQIICPFGHFLIWKFPTSSHVVTEVGRLRLLKLAWWLLIFQIVFYVGKLILSSVFQ